MAYLRVRFFLMAIFVANNLFAQCPNTDFSFKNPTCQNEDLTLSNLTTNGFNYHWDFCSGDLREMPSADKAATLGAGNTTTGIAIKKEDDQWISFATSRGNNKLFRLEYGTDLGNIPGILDLGNIGGFLSGPENIDIVFHQGSWYGFIVNITNFHLIRINFGNSLFNTPTAEDLGDFGLFNRPRDVEIKNDKGEWIVAVSNTSANSLTLLNFGSSPANTPDPATDILTVNGIPGLNAPLGISLIKECDAWFGLWSSNSSNQVLKLDFGTSLFSLPTHSTLPVSIVRPTEIKIINEQSIYYGLVINDAGQFYRLDFGSSMQNTPNSTNFGNLSLLNRTFSLDIARDGSNWLGFTMDFSTKDLFRIEWPDNCSSSISSSEQFEPTVSYQRSGAYSITLASEGPDGSFSTISKDVMVSVDEAPDINLLVDGSCVISPFNFSGTSTSSIISWNWEFGDGQNGSGQEISHTYSASGSYDVSLSVSDGTCNNRTVQTIEVLDAPSPTFSTPTGQLCTNTPLIFLNTTSQNLGSNVTWEWQVDGANVSNEEDLTYAFSTTGSHDVKLIATIPGCSGVNSQVISGVEEGANTSFLANDHCQGIDVQFDNLTTGGSGNTSLWDFGNDFTSTQENPLYQYPDAGEFNVTLTTTSSNGCVTSAQSTLTSFSLPQPNFSVDLPPFSCSNSPTQFSNLTPAPSDDNITFWQWEFVDGSGATSNEQNPNYTYDLPGNYPVRLTARTSFGCEATIEKNAAIAEGPIADFNFSPACLEEEVQFTDLSVAPSIGTITKWFWEIDGQGFFTQNPTYTFTNPADYDVKLTVTSNNECVTEITRTLTVNSDPAVDFSVENTCTGSPTIFTDVTEPNNDPITTHTWDFSGLGSAHTPNTEFQFPIPGDYTVSLLLQTEGGCQYELAKSVAINPSPEAAFEAAPTAGPPPLVVQFTNQSGGGESFQWFFTGTDENQSNEISPTFTYNEFGKYNATMVATNSVGCTDTAKQRIAVVEASVDIELRQISIIPVDDQSQIVLTLSNNGQLPISNMDILIDIGGEVVINELFTGTIDPGELTNYVVGFRLTTATPTPYFCISLLPNTGFEERNTSDNQECQNLTDQTVIVTPFPNPASERLRVQIVLNEPETITLQLFDNGGKQAISQSFSATTAGLNDFGIATSNLEKGLYLLRVITPSKSENFRVMINNQF